MTHPRSIPPADNPDNDDAASVADARERATTLGSGPPDIDSIKEAITDLDQATDAVWQSYLDAFVAAARSSHPEAWTEALEKALAEGCAQRGTTHSGLIHGVAEHWNEVTDPLSVWDSRWAHISSFPIELLPLALPLLALNASAGLRALEHLPHPAPLAELVHSYSSGNPMLVRDLIAAAPPVFDSDGRWIPERNISALIVTDFVVTHATSFLFTTVAANATGAVDEAARVENDNDLRRLLDEELPEWLEEAFNVLLQRDDGTFIALGYLSHLVRTYHSDSVHRDVVALAIQTLAGSLRTSGVGLQQVRDAWQGREVSAVDSSSGDARPRVDRPASGRRSDREGEGARHLHTEGLPALLGGVAIVGYTLSPQVLDELWSWFEMLLEGRDPGLFLARRVPALFKGARENQATEELAALFALLPDVSARLRDTYRALQPQRRRFEFRQRYDDHDIDVPSLLLLRTSMHVADHLASGDLSASGAARDLLLWVYREALRLWLTDPIDVYHERAHLVVDCFSFVPKIFAPALADAVNEMVPPIANDPIMLSNACGLLASHGLDAEQLLELVGNAGGDLAEALRDAQAWSTLTGRAEFVLSEAHELANRLRLE